MRLFLPSSVHNLQEDVELEWLQQADVLYYRLEFSHSKAVTQLKHNPWSLKCQQHHLQKMKENAKHRNQYSILSQPEDDTVFLDSFLCQHSMSQWNETGLIVQRFLKRIHDYLWLQHLPEVRYLIQCLAINVFVTWSPSSKALPSVT